MTEATSVSPYMSRKDSRPSKFLQGHEGHKQSQQSELAGNELQSVNIQKNKNGHPLVTYTSQQQLHQTSLRQFQKSKNTESCLPNLATEKVLIEPHKGVILNSITDDSEAADAIPEQGVDEVEEAQSKVNNKNLAKAGAPLANKKITYEHTFGKSSQKVMAMDNLRDPRPWDTFKSQKSTFSLKFGGESNENIFDNTMSYQ